MINTVVVVFVMLQAPDGSFFLLQRAQGLRNDCFDGVFSLPGGEVDAHETLREAACREAKEEIDVTIDIDDLEFMHVGNHFALPTKKIVGIIFRARRWKGIPNNLEPQKHTQAEWFTRDALPENLCPFVAACLTETPFSENLIVASIMPADQHAVCDKEL